jgi:hypothetical protein
MNLDAMNLDAEMRRADELDALITELLGESAGAEPASARPPEMALAAALVEASRAATPDAGFAAELEARLQASDGASVGGAGGGAHGHGRPSRERAASWKRWLALAAMVALAIVLLAPPARAGVELVIRIGAVRIGLAPQPHATPTPQPGATPTPTPLPSPLDLAGATTLDQARAHAGFAIRLPAYPPDLGMPQHVYLQDLGGPAVALVWTDPARPDRVRLALFEMASGVFLQKSNAHIVAETAVSGNRAIWTEGPYLVEVVRDGQVDYDTRRLVTGHVLIWTEGSITYRLETELSLDEAVRIAESLR